MTTSEPVSVCNQKPYKTDQFVVPTVYKPFIERILIPSGTIESRVDCLALEISKKYSAESADIVALGVLNGAIKFFADLLHNKEMQAPFEMETCRASSYVGDKSSGKVSFTGFDFSKVRKKAVLVVEDIMDTGLTLDALTKEIAWHSPKSIEIACLLEKPDCRDPKVEVKADYVGFTIPDTFVVGYGLDYNNRFRGLSHLCILKEDVYKKR